MLYTTHYLEEAESLCDRLAIVDHGGIIAAGTLSELRATAGESDLLVLRGRFDPDQARVAFWVMAGVEVVEAATDALRLALPDASHKLAAGMAYLEITLARWPLALAWSTGSGAVLTLLLLVIHRDPRRSRGCDRCRIR